LSEKKKTTKSVKETQAKSDHKVEPQGKKEDKSIKVEKKNNKRRFLAIEAHPDDLTFFYGGSISKFIDEGHEVRVITVTNGSQSTTDPKYTENTIIETLMKEHKEALSVIGVKDHIQLEGFTNHFMYDSPTQLKLREVLIRAIREYKPDTVICFDPMNIMEENPDHKLLAQVVIEASSFAAYPLIHKEHMQQGLLPYFVSRVLMTPTPHPNVFVNIAGDPLDAKKKAGTMYKSQLDLMFSELRIRIQNIGLDPDLDDIDPNDLWDTVCETDAQTVAKESWEFYKKNPKLAPIVPLEYAESFRMCYLGAVEKIRSYLPKECLTLE
jgi:LmbE family N-acetylglucosaminyl deacetylase